MTNTTPSIILNTLKNNASGGIKITKIPFFLIALIAISISSVAFSGCVDEEPDVVIVEVPTPTDDEVLDQAVVCETEDVDVDIDNEDCGTCYQPGEVPEITGTVERYRDGQYKVTLYIKNTHKNDFVYDAIRTELDTDQGDVICNMNYIEKTNDRARHIIVREGYSRRETIYTASINDLDNIKGSGEMTLRVAFDLKGKEQCSLDATLPDYNRLNSRQNLRITEVRNINDD